MKPKSDHRQINQTYFQASRVFYQGDFNGHGEGWYFMLGHSKPYGPFKNKDVTNAALADLVKRLSNGEPGENVQQQG